MTETYCLECTILKNQKELALVVFYAAGMLGSEEKENGENIILLCYFDTRNGAEQAENNVTEIISTAKTSIFEVEERDWNEKWRDSIEPVQVSENIWVSPKWLMPPLKEDDHLIKIEPKMAFGTGHHETTRLTAQAILTIDISDKKTPTLLDIGTGSGILCFISDYKGYQTSLGIEIDPNCAGNIIENKNDNRAEHRVDFIIGTVKSIKEKGVFDTIVMNMLRSHSEPHLDICTKILKSDGHLVWSGILQVEKGAVIKYAHIKGWEVIAESTEGEWWCGILKRR